MKNYGVICKYDFEANHNKDYSVVKTFKAGKGFLCSLSYCSYLSKKVSYFLEKATIFLW